MGFETEGGEGYKPENHGHVRDGEVNKMRGTIGERYVPMEEKRRGYYSMKGKETVLFQKAEHTETGESLGKNGMRHTSKERRLRKTGNKPREVMSSRTEKERTVIKKTPKA